MKRAGYLFDGIVEFEALRAAARRAARGKRDRPEAAAFLVDQEGQILRLQDELRAGSWMPGPYRIFVVHDPKTRIICAPPFRDRVVHHAICTVLEPLFERVAIFDSYACRVGKGAHAAIRRAQQLARGSACFLKLDVERFFDSIDHAVLKARLRRLVKDARVLALADRIIDDAPPGAAPGKGLPIGSLTSQHFANLYLADLDHHIKQELRVGRYVRYMDDLLLFGGEKAALHAWRDDLAAYAAGRLRLALKERATVLAPVSEGVPFLGVRIWPGVRRLDARRKTRLIRAVGRARAAVASGSASARTFASLAGSIEAARSAADGFRLCASAMKEVWTEDRSASRAPTG